MQLWEYCDCDVVGFVPANDAAWRKAGPVAAQQMAEGSEELYVCMTSRVAFKFVMTEARGGVQWYKHKKGTRTGIACRQIESKQFNIEVTRASLVLKCIITGSNTQGRLTMQADFLPDMNAAFARATFHRELVRSGSISANAVISFVNVSSYHTKLKTLVPKVVVKGPMFKKLTKAVTSHPKVKIEA